MPAQEHGRSTTGFVALRADYLSVANELRGEFRRPAALRCGTSQNQSIPAVLNDGLRVSVTIGVRHLRDRLKSQDTAPTEFPQPGQRILEPVDRPERIELVNDEPESLISFPVAHRLEDRQADPCSNHTLESCDLRRLIWNEEHTRAVLHPVSYGKG